MKKLHLKKTISCALTLVLLLSVTSLLAFATDPGVGIQEENFPDAVFRQWVLENVDADKNGFLSQTEIDKTTEIYIPNMGIEDLKGVEYFTAVELLECAQNQLKTLDLSKNTALRSLECSLNLSLTSLNVAQCPELESLGCEEDCLSDLDVSHNKKLCLLSCQGNALHALDLRENPALEWLYCSGNNLTELDLSQNVRLYSLECDVNALISINVENCKDLKWFYCRDNSYEVEDGCALSTMPFLDLTKVSALQGGSFEDGIVRFDENSDEITYQYDCGNGRTAEFMLKRHKHCCILMHAAMPTCTKTGYTSYFHCPFCERNFEDEACTKEILDLTAIQLPMLPHTAEYVAEIPPTKEVTGTKAHYQCAVCGKLFMDAACTEEITDLETLVLPKLPESEIPKNSEKPSTEVNTQTDTVVPEIPKTGAKTQGALEMLGVLSAGAVFSLGYFKKKHSL